MNSEGQAQRVLVVANKSWEADPLVSVCLNPKLRPAIQLDLWSPGAAGLFSTPVTGVRPAAVAPAPRCVCTAGTVSIEVWCIQDWMGKANPSSSKIKIQEALPAIFNAGKQPDFVIAFGTAGFPDAATANGCVAVGSSAYLFNPYRDPPPGVTHDPKDDWDDPSAMFRSFDDISRRRSQGLMIGGIVTLFTGIGLSAMLIVMHTGDNAWAIGLVPGLIGLALILSGLLVRPRGDGQRPNAPTR